MKTPFATSGDTRNPTVHILNQPAIRDAFWEAHPQFKRRGRRVRQNAYPCDVRVAFVDFVESLARSGEIHEALANRATL